MVGTRKTAIGRSSSTTRSQRSASKRGLVDHLQAELHGRVDEGDAGEGEKRAGVQPPAAGPVRLDRADHRRRWSGGPPPPWGARSSPRCRGCRPGPRTGAGPGRASGRRRWPRPSPSTGTGPSVRRHGPVLRRRRRSGRRGGPPPPRRSLRSRSPSATTAVAPECSSMWATSAGARRGFIGTATPPARWAAEYETSQRKASSGCRWMPTRAPGSRPASRRRRAMALAAPSHSANVMDPTSTTAKAVRSPNSSAIRARWSSINTSAGPPEWLVGAES